MATSYIPNDLAGGFKYTPVSFSFGSTGQQINGGYAFDLPLATVSGFTNAALDFTRDNSNAARGFFNNVYSQAQTNVTAIADLSYDLQQQSLRLVDTMQQRQMDVQRYAIKKGFSKGSCFITTAVTKAKGLPDDCHELQTLRAFRDDWLRGQKDGEGLIALYYATAPAIVEAIDANPLAASIYARLDSLFIQPALQRIGCGDFEEAKAIYTALVFEAARVAAVGIGIVKVEPTCNCGGGNKAPNFHKKTCPVRG